MKEAVKNAIDWYLALWVRLLLRRRTPVIVGITGSVGKTTSKEVIAAVLSAPGARSYVGRIRKSPENLNNNRGLPLAILGYQNWLSRRQLFSCFVVVPLYALWHATVGRFPNLLVLEYSASEHGDVPWLASVAPPTVAVVTAIGPAHLQRFGTIDRIVEEKGALVAAVPPHGLVVLGSESMRVPDLERKSRARVVKVDGRGRTLSDNVARAVAAFFGIPGTIVERALPVKPTVRGRLDVRDVGDITLIDDCFSANPLSMELGLHTFAERARPDQRKIAILGEMLELGSEAARYHEQIGELAHSVAEVIVGVGALARHYRPHRWYATADECAADVDAIVDAGDLVFVKGSAAVALYRVCSAVKRWSRNRMAHSA